MKKDFTIIAVLLAVVCAAGFMDMDKRESAYKQETARMRMELNNRADSAAKAGADTQAYFDSQLKNYVNLSQDERNRLEDSIAVTIARTEKEKAILDSMAKKVTERWKP